LIISIVGAAAFFKLDVAGHLLSIGQALDLNPGIFPTRTFNVQVVPYRCAVYLPKESIFFGLFYLNL